MKVIEGWIDWDHIYTTKEAWDKGNPYREDVIPLSDLIEEFANKKIRITIEEV